MLEWRSFSSPFATIFLVYLGIWVNKAPCYFHYLKLLTLVLESSKLSPGKNWDSSPSHLHWICLPSYWEFLLYFFFYPLQNTAGVRRSVTAEDIRLIPHVERDAKVYCGDHHQRGLIGSLVASRPVYYYDESNGP